MPFQFQLFSYSVSVLSIFNREVHAVLSRDLIYAPSTMRHATTTNWFFPYPSRDGPLLRSVSTKNSYDTLELKRRWTSRSPRGFVAPRSQFRRKRLWKRVPAGFRRFNRRSLSDTRAVDGDLVGSKRRLGCRNASFQREGGDHFYLRRDILDADVEPFTDSPGSI